MNEQTQEDKSDDLIWIQANLNVPKNRENKFGGFNYRNAEDILNAVKPLLDDRGCKLKLTDKIVLIGDRYYIQATAIFKNSAGEKTKTTGMAREPGEKKGMDESQITGAASSYARKYALNGLFLIDDSQDADSFMHVAESEIDAFCDLVDNGQGAKLFMMQINDREKYIALSKAAAPKGGKVKFKENLTDLVMGAVSTAQSIAERINELAECDDSMGIKEIVEEMGADEKQVLWRQLTDVQREQVKSILKV